MAVHRFPPFEFDPATLQLWKNGHPVKLQRKPALVLAALLENHGEPLARPEICARLWPAGTFVDFELSLNVAVKKLRDSLDDSADQPQFIQTIAGQGYRFIGRCDSLFLAQPSVIEPPLPPLISAAPRRFRFGSAAILALVPVFVASAFMATSKPPVSYRAANFRQITHSGTEKTPFATDGERIYFFELRGDQTSLTQTSVNGGDELRLPASASVLPYQADVRGTRWSTSMAIGLNTSRPTSARRSGFATCQLAPRGRSLEFAARAFHGPARASCYVLWAAGSRSWIFRGN